MVASRHAIFALLANALFSCLVLAPLQGCGNSDAAKPPSPIPQPQPGANPQSLPQTVLRFINQSSVSPADFADATAKINQQIIVDLNPRWGTNGAAAVWTGGFDDTIPSVVLQDRADGPGGYTDSVCGYVAYRANTQATFKAYLSHVSLNLLTGHYLASENVRAWDYRASDYAEQEPWELCDFDFPSAHGLGGTYYNHRGEPAHDLLSRLPYP